MSRFSVTIVAVEKQFVNILNMCL